MCLNRSIQHFWLWCPQENICGNRNFPFPTLYVLLNESHEFWPMMCPLQPLKAVGSHQKAWSWKGHCYTLTFLLQPQNFLGSMTGEHKLSTSAFLKYYTNIQIDSIIINKIVISIGPLTLLGMLLRIWIQRGPREFLSLEMGSHFRTIRRAQKEPLRLWGVRFQVQKHHKISKTQETAKHVSALHQCLICQAALAFQGAVTKAAQCRFISEQGSSPYVFIAIRNYKM